MTPIFCKGNYLVDEKVGSSFNLRYLRYLRYLREIFAL